MIQIAPPPHIVWSTNTVDLSDPFQNAFLAMFLAPFDPWRLKDEFHSLALALMARISAQTDTENAW